MYENSHTQIGLANIKKDDIPMSEIDSPEYKYIGRQNSTYGLSESVLHNPFKVSEYGRFNSVLKYVDYFYDKLDDDSEFEEAVSDCYGKTLLCWCIPKLCHGHVIVLHYVEDYVTAKVDGERNLDVIKERVKQTIELLDSKY